MILKELKQNQIRTLFLCQSPEFSSLGFLIIKTSSNKPLNTIRFSSRFSGIASNINSALSAADFRSEYVLIGYYKMKKILTQKLKNINQRRIQNPVKHLRWKKLHLKITKSSILTFDWVFNTHLSMTE